MRISLDLDNYPRNIVDCKARFIAYHYGLDVKIYQTAHGYHVESSLIPVSEAIEALKILSIRESLGDDPCRVRMDAYRIAKLWEWDILFYVKGNHERKLVGSIKAESPLRIA